MIATAVTADPADSSRPTGVSPALRAATRDDAAGIHALIARYQAPGRLLPRTEGEIARHADRFLVIVDDGEIVGCAELAPLSVSMAEVRSLVIDEHLRGLGLGRALVDELTREARVDGFASICAFTHEPAYFARLGFSLVPHAWLHEKIATDCNGCPLFRRCGQAAMRLRLDEQRQKPERAAGTYACQ
jgi:N-acetylglutamate synthase-like GNAT family acetyltransferase